MISQRIHTTTRRKTKTKINYRKLILVIALIGYIGYNLVNIISTLTMNHKSTQNKGATVQSTDPVIQNKSALVQSTDPVIQTLLKKSNNNPQVVMMLNNINSYPKELLELAANNDELIDYVANYPNHDSSKNTPISIKNEYTKGKIPHFIQWDERWGYDKYGSDFIAINGCGPTSLAMVAVGLTGNTNINPKVVADFSESMGYVVKGQGSSWTLMSDGAKHFGLNPKELPLSKNIIINTLKSGQPIIASMAPGTFTNTGHYLVLTGVDKNNKIIVNDSNSKIKSKQTWDIDIFMKETKNLWTFTAN